MEYLGLQGLPSNDVALLLKWAETESTEETLRLMAVRLLGLWRETTSRAALTKLAGGPPGFLRDHAQAALERIESQSLLPRQTAEPWVVRELDIFPNDDVAMLLAAKPRLLVQMPHPAYVRALKEAQQSPLYQVLQSVGNVRIDGFAAAEYRTANGNSWVFHLSGRFDQRMIIGQLKGLLDIKVLVAPGNVDVATIAADVGEFQLRGQIRGDTELVVVVSLTGDADAMNKRVLDVRDGKAPNVSTGPWKMDIDGIPIDTVAFALGEPAECKLLQYGVPESLQSANRLQMVLYPMTRGAAVSVLGLDIGLALPIASQLGMEFRAVFDTPKEAEAGRNELERLKSGIPEDTTVVALLGSTRWGSLDR